MAALKMPFVILGAICTLPLIALGWLAPAICIVWLLALGKWGLLLFGVALGFIAPMVISAVVGGVASLLAFGSAKMPKAAIRVGVWALQAVTFCLVVIYGLWVFAFALHHYDRGSLWPYLLWAFGTAVTPWQAIGSKAGSKDAGAVLWCSTSQFGGLAMLVALATGHYYGSGLYFILGAAVGAVTGLVMASEQTQGASKAASPWMRLARG